jgi:hypothetical protein
MDGSFVVFGGWIRPVRKEDFSAFHRSPLE